VEQLPLIAAVITVILLFTSVLGIGAWRWTSFAARVDRRSARRHQFEDAWGAVLSEAERSVRAERAKSRPRHGPP
jgi:hypothetical protein